MIMNIQYLNTEDMAAHHANALFGGLKWLQLGFQGMNKMECSCLNNGSELIGTKYLYPKSMEIIAKYGQPETLHGTTVLKWIAYFPIGKFSIVLDKKTNVIEIVTKIQI